jgi:hypothetical protein
MATCSETEESSASLALLLERAATLPTVALVRVLRDLPMPELARLSCVHKAYLVAWQSLQKEHPGSRYAPPTSCYAEEALDFCHLVRASAFGDIAVVKSLLDKQRKKWTPGSFTFTPSIEGALFSALRFGHKHLIWPLVNHLIITKHDEAFVKALKEADNHGHGDVVELLMQERLFQDDAWGPPPHGEHAG